MALRGVSRLSVWAVGEPGVVRGLGVGRAISGGRGGGTLVEGTSGGGGAPPAASVHRGKKTSFQWKIINDQFRFSEEQHQQENSSSDMKEL